MGPVPRVVLGRQGKEVLGDGWVNVERLDSFNRYTIAGNLWSGINRDLLLVDGLDDDRVVGSEMCT